MLHESGTVLKIQSWIHCSHEKLNVNNYVTVETFFSFHILNVGVRFGAWPKLGSGLNSWQTAGIDEQDWASQAARLMKHSKLRWFA